MSAVPMVTDTGIRLAGDPSRVLARLFVPGQEFAGTEDPGRTGLAARIAQCAPAEVDAALVTVLQQFGNRHQDLLTTLRRHGTTMAARGPTGTELSEAQLLLLGAAFTCEESIEGAALCNPSMVRSPDQRGVAPGSVAFVMSVRAIAEGHRSCIGFRTGVVDADGQVVLHAAEAHPVGGMDHERTYLKRAFHLHLEALGQDGEGAASVLGHLDEEFTQAALDAELLRLRTQRDSPVRSNSVADRLQGFARRHYARRFDPEVALSRRVLLPGSPAESQGVEDARFVAFDDGGLRTYLATYTAFDGRGVHQQLLETEDFLNFSSTPLLGQAATNKGLALFPRKIGGRYAALSRHDRESNSIAFSDDRYYFGATEDLVVPRPLWATVQVGNCGAPIETEAGWLVLTHGVGLLRTYRIGAMLLDLEDPSVVLGVLAAPLALGRDGERDGYVPNVVYSCGAMAHGANLILPFGIADSTIGVATINLAELLDALTPLR